MYSKSVSSIKYFEQCHESLVSDMVMAMKPFSVLKDEFVFVQHEIAAHVFFLLKGKVNLIKTLSGSGEERRLSTLSVGDHFGEVRISFSRRSVASLRGLTERFVVLSWRSGRWRCTTRSTATAFASARRSPSPTAS